MRHFLLFGAILLTTTAYAQKNLTCHDCSECTLTKMKTSIGNRFCIRVEVLCPTVDIHLIDLMGDRRSANSSLNSCGQTRSYSSTCTIAYYCCYTDRCNQYEKHAVPPERSPAPSTSLNPIVMLSLTSFFAYLCMFH